jgi:hypothetical protein
MSEAETDGKSPPPPGRQPGTASRRFVLRALSGLPLTVLAPPAEVGRAEPYPDGARILVAGPAGGRLNLLAQILLPAFGHALPGGTEIAAETAGGADGVTAANRFEARVAPDGGTVLMVPGAAALAWLVGDRRAQFDAARWLPIMAGTTPAFLLSQVGPAELMPGARLRMAAASPAGGDLSGLLAIELLGLRVEPVFGLADQSAVRAALAARTVDTVLVSGQHVAQRVAALAELGARPLLCLNVAEPADARAHAKSDTPGLPELATRLRGRPPSGPLYVAWRAVAAAAQLEFALMLPQLTPADLVALWRSAGVAAAAAVAVQFEDHEGIRLATFPATNTLARNIAAPAGTLLELRRWLAARFNYQPA